LHRDDLEIDIEAAPFVNLVVEPPRQLSNRHAGLHGQARLARERPPTGIEHGAVATGHYTLRPQVGMAEAAASMDRGDVRVILQIPEGFTAARTLQLVADGSDPNSAQLIASEISRVIAQASLTAASAGVAPAVAVEERAWFNPNLEDRWYFVPGIMANVIFVTTLMLGAMIVVREREFGTLERLMVTRWHASSSSCAR
jgi:hypothetical protein